MKFYDWMSQFVQWWGKVDSFSDLNRDEAYQGVKRAIEGESLQEARILLKRWQYICQQQSQLKAQEKELRDQLRTLQEKADRELVLESGEKLQFDFSSEKRWQDFWKDCEKQLKISPSQGSVPVLQNSPEKDVSEEKKAFQKVVREISSKKLYDSRYLDQESDELLRLLSV